MKAYFFFSKRFGQKRKFSLENNNTSNSDFVVVAFEVLISKNETNKYLAWNMQVVHSVVLMQNLSAWDFFNNVHYLLVLFLI